MTHYEDLSPYEYAPHSIPDGVRAVNVGWLEPDRDFPRGETAEDFIITLSDVTKEFRQMKMRGWHRCIFPHGSGEDVYPVTVEIDGQRVPLGGAEVRVISTSGDWMIAPDLILHYVTDHSYQPPKEFITAVIEKRIAPSLKN